MKFFLRNNLRLAFMCSLLLFLNHSILSQNTWQNITQLDDFNDVCFGNGKFVAVGNQGISSSSTDGYSWVSHNPVGVTQNLWRVKYLNSLYIAVGDNGTIITSSDGLTWSIRTSTTTKALYGVTYANSKFVVVGDGVVLTSATGSTWIANAVAPTEFLLDVAFGNSKFVATSFTGAIKTSTDGLSWTLQASGTTNFLFSIIYQNSLFVAVGNSGTILTSADGTAWSPQASGTSTILFGLTYGNGRFVTSNANGTLLTSLNGINWVVQSSPTNQYLYGIAYGNSTFSSVSLDGITLTSADGTTWTQHQKGFSLPLSASLGEITYNGQYTCLSRTGFNGMVTSTDGINWTKQAGYDNNFVSSITYDNTGKLYGVTSSGNVLVSTLANQWAAPINISGQALYDITFGGGKFFVGSNFGLIYSGNGTSWPSTMTPSLLPTFSKVEYLNSAFVGLGTYPTTTVVFSSANGSSLVQKGTINSYLSGIAYGNSLYVVVGDAGAIYSSPDLITWTPRTSGTTQALRGITYGFGVFVAVGDAGTLLTSPDGIIWTPKNSNTTNNLGRVIASSNNNNSALRVAATPGFVAVGGSVILFSVAESTPLPINLVNFKAIKEGEIVVLNWNTSSETNSDRFEIERSSNTKNWHNIGMLKAHRNTKNTTSDYSLQDLLPLEGLNYYRLKAIDIDGSFSYERIISLNFESIDELNIYPNPANDKIYFDKNSSNKLNSIEIYNSLGRQMTNYSLKNTEEIDVSGLTEGYYAIKFIYTNGSASYRKVLIR